MAAIPTLHDLVGANGMTLMSTKAFNKRKGSLLPQLRERTDPPPRLMRVGSGAHESYGANLRAQIALVGGVPVRGFKLFKFKVDKGAWSTPPWCAFAHVVVATTSPSGSTIYTDPNNHAEDKFEYIFVPSARVHRELTDEQLLSDDWHTGSVVGGPVSFCERFIAHERLHGRERSVISFTPEELVSKPKVVVRLGPHFAEWHRLSGIGSDIEEIAEMMGATVFPCNAAPEAHAEIDALRALKAVRKNSESCVDGVRGLKLELKCSEQLMSGELSVADARRLFLSHYDSVYSAVCAVKTLRFAEWSVVRGNLAECFRTESQST